MYEINLNKTMINIKNMFMVYGILGIKLEKVSAYALSGIQNNNKCNRVEKKKIPITFTIK